MSRSCRCSTASPVTPRSAEKTDIDQLLVWLGIALVLGGQAVAIATWWALNKLTLDQLQAQPRLFVPYMLTFGMAAATRRGSIGRAIVEAEPERGPHLQRRFRRALLVTLLGVLVAFAALAR